MHECSALRGKASRGGKCFSNRWELQIYSARRQEHARLQSNLAFSKDLLEALTPLTTAAQSPRKEGERREQGQSGCKWLWIAGKKKGIKRVFRRLEHKFQTEPEERRARSG